MDPKLKIERLWLLVGVAERAREEEFNMVYFGYLYFREKHRCGTTACLIGSAMVDPIFKRAARGHFTGVGPTERRRFFDLDGDEDHYIFGSRELIGGEGRHCDTPAIAAQRVLDVIYANGG